MFTRIVRAIVALLMVVGVLVTSMAPAATPVANAAIDTQTDDVQLIAGLVPNLLQSSEKDDQWAEAQLGVKVLGTSVPWDMYKWNYYDYGRDGTTVHFDENWVLTLTQTANHQVRVFFARPGETLTMQVDGFTARYIPRSTHQFLNPLNRCAFLAKEDGYGDGRTRRYDTIAGEGQDWWSSTCSPTGQVNQSDQQVSAAVVAAPASGDVFTNSNPSCPRTQEDAAAQLTKGQGSERYELLPPASGRTFVKWKLREGSVLTYTRPGWGGTIDSWKYGDAFTGSNVEVESFTFNCQ